MGYTGLMRKELVVVLCLAALTLAAFRPVLDNGFVNYDDDAYVYANPHVSSGLTLSTARWAFITTHAANWHPLTWLSHALDVSLFGMNPHAHHLVSLLLHIASVVLLFLVLTGLTRSPWRSALVAALFAVHPLHVESVAWISERKDVLSTLLMFLAMLAYAQYVRGRGKNPPTPVWTCRMSYALVVVLLALGLMAKQMLVTLPFVLLLIDWWPLGRLPALRSALLAAWEKAPLFALSAAASAAVVAAQRAGGAVHPLSSIPFGVRAANAVVSCAVYMRKAIWPSNLTVYYPHPMDSLPVWQIVGSAGLVASISVVACLQRRNRPYLLVGWLWYLVTLAPVIGLVQVGSQAMADRYTYVPLVGLFIAVTWLVADLMRPKAAAAAAVAVIIVLSVLTWHQARTWQNSRTLFSHALSVTRDNDVAHNNLANALREDGETEEAIDHYLAALKITPNDDKVEKNLGLALASIGRYAEAEAHMRRGLAIMPRDARACEVMGEILMAQGKHARAAEAYRSALRLDPGNLAAANDLAMLLATSPDSSVRDGASAVRLARSVVARADREKQPIALDTLAAAYAECGEFAEALSTAREARAAGLRLGQRDLASEIACREALYKKRRPYRQRR